MKKPLLILFFFCFTFFYTQTETVDKKLDTFLIESGIFESRNEVLFEYTIKPLKRMITKTTEAEWNAFESKLSDKELLRLYREPYKKIFSEKEIDEITKFYTSETGKKLIQNAEEIELELNKNLAWIPQTVEAMVDKEQLMKVGQDQDNQPPFPTNKKTGFYAVLSGNEMDFSKLKLENEPSVLISDIESFEKNVDDLGRFELSLQLNAEGALKFHQLSYHSVGRPIAIVINKKIVMAPVVNEPIPNGRVLISGNFTEKEVDDLINYLHKVTKDGESN